MIIMSAPPSSKNKNAYILIISLLTLSVFLSLYTFRILDDNRLTSWKWVFIGLDISKIVLILVTGMLASYALLRIPFPKQYSSVLLFVLSFGLGAVLWREPEVIVDISRYFTQAKHLELYGIKYFITQWGRDINIWTDLPIMSFFYGLIFKFFGESRIYIQVFTTLLFSMTVVLTCLIGKTLWNESLGFYAGLMLLGMPYLFTQVPLMLVDVPVMFFLTLVIFAFIKAMERGGANMILFASVSIFLAFFSKYSAWLMLSVTGVVFFVYLVSQSTENPGVFRLAMNRDVLYRGLLVALVSSIFIGAVVLYKFDVISEQIIFLRKYQMPGLKRWGESFLSTFCYQVHPFITIAALYSVYAALRKKDLKYLIISWLLLLVVLLQIRRSRYVMVVFPMLALMASYGLHCITDRQVKRFIASCVLVSSIVIAVFVFLPSLQRMSAMNMKNAGLFLDTLDAENIEVFTLPQKRTAVNPVVAVPILDYFTDKNIFYDYKKPILEEWVKTSSLRFTWEYEVPEYYVPADKKNFIADAVVVISNRADPVLPDNVRIKTEGRSIVAAFTYRGVFRYKPIVTIYK